LHVTGDIPREALISGDRVFQSVEREPTIVIGDTGISSGIGTDTAKAQLNITVAHTSTTIAGASGVAVGTSSIGGDTLVGLHKLKITDTSGNGTAGTISLNDGGPISFTSGDTDLQVRGPTGELIYLDTTAITPGFDGTVDVTANGTLSIDGGATTQPIVFGTSEIVTIPNEGTVVHFDTTTLRKAGTDAVEFPGTTDAFQVLIALRDDLRNSRDLTGDQRNAAFSRRLSDIERIENHLLDEIGVQGVALQQMDRLEIRTEDQSLEQQIKYGETVNADLAEAAVRMQELLNLQQFTMASVSRLLSQNLLDFIQ
jgi:flagellin-like hook-associated protein FlgL